MSNKPESSRLNVLYIVYVLSNYSDEEHPMSVTEIKEKVDEEFCYLSLGDCVISIDTVKRTLDELTDKLFVQGTLDSDLEFRFGYYIYCVMLQNKQFVPYRVLEGKQAPKKFYYYESSLKTAELLTLKDAIETYNFFSEDDITEIIRKLIKLRPQSFPISKYFDVARNERDENSLLLMNIEDLNRIIQNRNTAMITYCYYEKDKKLTPRAGYPKQIEPLHLMWSNGYYYLLAYNEKYQNIISLRVDRITDIQEMEIENTHRVDNFNPVLYRYEHPVMYGGKTEKMTLLCRDTGKNYIMNTIVDFFGKNAHVAVAADDMVIKYLHRDVQTERKQGITWLKLTVKAATGGVEMWASQYCNDCVIVSPKESRDRVKERLQQGNLYYMES